MERLVGEDMGDQRGEGGETEGVGRETSRSERCAEGADTLRADGGLGREERGERRAGARYAAGERRVGGRGEQTQGGTCRHARLARAAAPYMRAQWMLGSARGLRRAEAMRERERERARERERERERGRERERERESI
jgi:hypothetical protein